jgi:hypothetical protein
VIDRPDAAVAERRRQGLAEIVAHRPQHDGDLARAIEIVDAPARLVDDEERVDPDVAFGVPFRFLRTADEGVDLGEELVDDTEIECQGETDRRPAREQQQFFDLPPDALRRQVVERDAAAEFPRGCIHLELEARRELQAAQDAEAIVTERARIDGPEHSALEQIAPPVERIEVGAGQRIPGDGVDREIAAARRVLGRHVRIADDRERLVSTAGLGFPARQRDIDVAHLVDGEAFADRVDRRERFEQRLQLTRRHAVDLDVDVFAGTAE